MSVLNKNWIILNEDPNIPIEEKILKNREIFSKEDTEKFLNPEKSGFYDPFLMLNMESAVDRIKKAIEKNERIIIFGDYDVDGISATAILVNVLKYLNANVSYRLPNRTNDGYGLNERFIEEFDKLGIKLLVTVDCGISCRDEIKLAKSKNIDVIITDHHTIPENFPSEAYAVIHPKLENNPYPFKELTGAGVAFKLAHALLKYFSNENFALLNSFLDFASLGTVADLGHLVDENRLIVKKGLESLRNTTWSGLKNLKKIAGIRENDDVDTVSIGYFLAPRINAAGRIDNPYFALQLLLEQNNALRSEILAQKLESINRVRQDLTEKGLKEAEIEASSLVKTDKIIVIKNSNWHAGIIGLIAGRLAERFSKPAIILQDSGESLVASARSTKVFNIIEALTKHKEYLEHFGGHAEAAGFDIKKENFEPFRKSIIEYANKNIMEEEIRPVISIDSELKADELTEKLFSFISRCAPFGMKNPKPKFLIKNLIPSNIKKVGRAGAHLRFGTFLNGKDYKIIGFNLGQFAEKIMGKELDMVCELNKNKWENIERLELKAVDFKICSKDKT